MTSAENLPKKHRYTAKPVRKEKAEGGGDLFLIEVYDEEEKAVVGTYERNFVLMDTFYPFTLGGKDYALYSPDYTATRVMSLPDCKDIGGDDPSSYGFCPVEFYVPTAEDYPPIFSNPDKPLLEYPFGLVMGFIWGDEQTMKLQFVDLRGIEEGKVVVDDRFGYFEIPQLPSLKAVVDSVDYDPTGNQPSRIYLAHRVEKVLFDKKDTPENESLTEESRVLFEFEFKDMADRYETERYCVPTNALNSGRTEIQDFYGHLLSLPKLSDDDRTKTFRIAHLVTGRYQPANEEEKLVYNAWLEYRVKSRYLYKLFDLFARIPVYEG